jgi:uncharacterized protein YndB with AHSA1/START domain
MDFIEPIRMTVRVRLRIEDAFALFTADIATWWPLQTHSFGGERAAELRIEPRVGGRFYERYVDGEEHTAGHVLEWDPPRVISFTWQHDDWIAPTDVVVRFYPEDGDVTRVELEHRAWERLGLLAVESRTTYANGWSKVLGRFVDAAGPAG